MTEKSANKNELRVRMRALRASYHADQRARSDEEIAARLFGLEAYRTASVVLSYLSFGTEVDTYQIVRRAWADGKVVAAPYCVPRSRQMRWFRIDSFDGLVRSHLGVEEPDPAAFQEVDAAAFDPSRAVALVPGLAFDRQGYRLGYGAGFFDVFLDGFAGTSVGLCRKLTLVRSLEELGCLDPHDVPVSLVLSE